MYYKHKLFGRGLNLSNIDLFSDTKLIETIKIHIGSIGDINEKGIS